MKLKTLGVDELLARCQGAHMSGSRFPTVWNTILRMHPLVLGLPIQVMIGSQPHLKVQLINGQHICSYQGGYGLD